MDRLKKLIELENDIYELMQKANSRTYASLAKQYRETLKEIEEIEGNNLNNDEISKILSGRVTDGKSGSVR